MSSLVVVSCLLAWYLVGWISFIGACKWKWKKVDREDVQLGFLFSLAGPLVIVCVLVGELILLVSKLEFIDSLVNWINKI